MISIIVDNYKRSYLLPLLIQAYNRQVWFKKIDDVEMVIVDDNSEDYFEEFLRLAIKAHKPWFEIRAFQTHKCVTYNQCLPVNIAVKKCRGDIIILNHSDVIPCCKPPRITLHQIWEKQKESGKFLIPMFIMNLCQWREHGGPLINGASMPKRMFEEVHGFDERFYGSPSEDIDLMFRLERKFGLVKAPDILFVHIHPSAEVPPRLRKAPWKPRLGIKKEEFNEARLREYNNNLVNENALKGPVVNPDGWGELDTLEELDL